MSYREIPEDRILKFRATPGFRGWSRFFTKESVSHPAKMNLNLLRWIIETYTELGEVVLDPMAGTGSTIILASLIGRHSVAVEYEPKFCGMIRANMNLTERQTTLTPKGRMTCLQGDARELSKLLGASDAIITSPPYAQGLRHRDQSFEEVREKLLVRGYSEEYIKASWSQPHQCQHWAEEAYGEDEKNIGNLPHADIDTVVTSPPYEAGPFDRAGGHGGAYAGGIAKRDEKMKPEKISDENIGGLKSENYLQAMLQVYRECWNVLKQSGKLILVTKNFIRNKQVVRLDLDTVKLCEAARFRLVDRWYFKLPTRSFWRILYKKRFPDVPEIDYEDILVFEKGIDIPRGKVND